MKKAKKTSTKGRDTKGEAAPNGSESEIPTTKKDRAMGRKVKAQAKTEKPIMDDESGDHEIVSQLPREKTRRPQKSAATRGTKADDDDTGVASRDVSNHRRGRKKAGPHLKIENDNEDDDLEKEQETHKSKRAPKKVKAHVSEAVADDEELEMAPKTKKGTKKAAPKANTRAKRPSVA